MVVVSADVTALCSRLSLCDVPVAELPLGDGRAMRVSVTWVVEDGHATSSVSLAVVEIDGTVREPMELDADVARLLSGALGVGATRAAAPDLVA